MKKSNGEIISSDFEFSDWQEPEMESDNQISESLTSSAGSIIVP